MTVLLGGYTQFEITLLVTAYYTSNIMNTDVVSVAEIAERFEIDDNQRWLMRSLTYFNEVGWSSEPLYHTDNLEDLRIELTSNGLREAEAHIERDSVVLRRRDSPSTRSPVPASDRIVSFDHNSRTFAEVARSLEAVKEAVRGLNGNNIDPEDRNRVLSALTAAQSLWDSAQLRLIQLKIGVVMAVEDAVILLAGTAKAVTAALLVDAIKNVVKSQSGIDLDLL